MKIFFKRLIAFYIDLVLIMAIMTFIILLLNILSIINTNPILISLTLGIIAILLMCSKDFLINNTSVGKLIMHLHIYNKENIIETNKKKLFFRTLITINFNFINIFALILAKKSVGDLLTNTYVK